MHRYCQDAATKPEIFGINQTVYLLKYLGVAKPSLPTNSQSNDMIEVIFVMRDHSYHLSSHYPPPSSVDTMALAEAGPGPTLLKGLTRTSYLV